MRVFVCGQNSEIFRVNNNPIVDNNDLRANGCQGQERSEQWIGGTLLREGDTISFDLRGTYAVKPKVLLCRSLSFLVVRNASSRNVDVSQVRRSDILSENGFSPPPLTVFGSRCMETVAGVKGACSADQEISHRLDDRTVQQSNIAVHRKRNPANYNCVGNLNLDNFQDGCDRKSDISPISVQHQVETEDSETDDEESPMLSLNHFSVTQRTCVKSSDVAQFNYSSHWPIPPIHSNSTEKHSDETMQSISSANIFQKGSLKRGFDPDICTLSSGMVTVSSLSMSNLQNLRNRYRPNNEATPDLNSITTSCHNRKDIDEESMLPRVSSFHHAVLSIALITKSRTSAFVSSQKHTGKLMRMENNLGDVMVEHGSWPDLLDRTLIQKKDLM